MAYTPLAIQVLRRDTLTISGTTFTVTTPVAGAQLELVNQLTGASANMLTRQGAIIATPVLTDTAGRAQVWVVNGIYEYRTVDPDTGLAVEDWAAFPAYRGRGAEDIVGVSIAESLPVASVLTMPNHGVENTVGSARVTMTFDHEHMGDVIIMLVPPWDTTVARSVVSVSGALSGGVALDAAEVEFRDAVTLASPTLYDAPTGGSVITPPYLTDVGGSFIGYHDGAILYQSRVPTSDNLTDWGPLAVGAGASVLLWNGPENIGFGMTDFAFDGTVTFAPTGGDSSSPFVDGDILGSSVLGAGGGLDGFASSGTWALWIAGGAPGTPGELASWAIELVPV